jgi:hypothetical protein
MAEAITFSLLSNWILIPAFWVLLPSPLRFALNCGGNSNLLDLDKRTMMSMMFSLEVLHLPTEDRFAYARFSGVLIWSSFTIAESCHASLYELIWSSIALVNKFRMPQRFPYWCQQLGEFIIVVSPTKFLDEGAQSYLGTWIGGPCPSDSESLLLFTILLW